MSQNHDLAFHLVKPAQRVYRNASVDRAFAVLECFSEDNDPLTLNEVVRRTKLTKATAFRFLIVLARNGYVERDGAGYHLGYRLFELGSRVKQHDAFRRRLHPVVANLAALVEETAHLGVLRGTNVLYTDRVDAPRPLRLQPRTGLDLDAHATGIGKVLLSFLPEDEVRQLYRGRNLEARTARTITNLETLIRSLRHVRSQGYGFDMGEFESGLCCVAAPVTDGSGHAPCALSVSGPASRITDLALPRIVAAVSAAAAEASVLLSGRERDQPAPVPARRTEPPPSTAFDPLFER
jgi:DNA-binding IclR family transcriptional regulator